ncbi:hypothetical protein Pan44_18150 [Caulifigura coniformis]|uniref:DUF2254 domain-containing protein n=1 Tax=Caulifigura coniformis TaxID=2527983 RepID=A0A517SCD4_9PLAN|nr:DUF2254 domain-containing protein [Caulifigura coniformis]QDT53791.1 hypothetical protein Pan44_18150 [Caulifigura coniformis]
MLSQRWRWNLQRLTKRLWARATLFCLLGIITALIANVLSPYISYRLSKGLGADAVESILTILASSMLTVTVFSLSTMVSAASAAANGATPRATRLLLEDSTAQSALSTFLGGFLFSLVGIIALNSNYYGDGGRSVMFLVTLAVIGMIVVTLVQWIDYLARLGRVGETIDLVEKTASTIMRQYVEDPDLGGTRLVSIPSDALPVTTNSIGYLLHVDAGQLSAISDELDADIFLATRPGTYCSPVRPLAHVLPRGQDFDEQEATRKILKAFSIGDDRSFDQDPRFGLVVLCEIGCRALSPAINDSGTAIDVIGTLIRVLSPLAGIDREDREVKHPRLFVPRISLEDFFEDAFLPLARDGASRVEVGLRLQKAAAALASMGRPELTTAAEGFAASALDRSLRALEFQEDRDRLEREAFRSETH